jgi:hypothetical protein
VGPEPEERRRQRSSGDRDNARGRRREKEQAGVPEAMRRREEGDVVAGSDQGHAQPVA